MTRGDGTTRTITPSGICPRFERSQKQVESIDGFDVFEVSFGELQDLPRRRKDTMYIVSSVVANAAKHRDDLLIPYTRRGENQKVEHVVGFSKISQQSAPTLRHAGVLERFIASLKIMETLNIGLTDIVCRDNMFIVIDRIDIQPTEIAKLIDLGWEYENDKHWFFSF